MFLVKSKRTKLILGLILIVLVIIGLGIFWVLKTGKLKPKADTLDLGNGIYQKTWDTGSGIIGSGGWSDWTKAHTQTDTSGAQYLTLENKQEVLTLTPRNATIRTGCLSTGSGEITQVALADAVNNGQNSAIGQRDPAADNQSVTNSFLTDCNQSDRLAFSLNFPDNWQFDYADATIDYIRLDAIGKSDPANIVDYPNPGAVAKIKYFVRNPSLPQGNDIMVFDSFPITNLKNTGFDSVFLNIKTNPFTGLSFQITDLRNYEFGFEIDNPANGKAWVDNFLVQAFANKYPNYGSARIIYPNDRDNPDPTYTGMWQFITDQLALSSDSPGGLVGLAYGEGNEKCLEKNSEGYFVHPLGISKETLLPFKAFCLEIQMQTSNEKLSPKVDYYSVQIKRVDAKTWPIALIDAYGDGKVSFTTNPPYTLVPNGAGGASGIINVPEGTNVTVNFVAAQGYTIQGVDIDGYSQGAITSYTFNNVVESHDVYVSTIKSTFKISSAAGAGGTITPVGDQFYPYNSSATYTIAADKNFVIKDVVVNGKSVGNVSSYTFSNIGMDQSITATFVRAGGGAGGGNKPPKK